MTDAVVQDDLRLTIESVDAVQRILRDLDLLENEESIASLAPAGDGNMNLTLRVQTSQSRSLIVKQSRPWVEKYPAIKAPVERIDAERRFYEAVGPVESLASRMPKLLAYSEAHHLLVLNDLGLSADMTSLYAAPIIEVEQLTALGEWLANLHSINMHEYSKDDFRNLALRRLNHAHIFEIPFGSAMPFSLDDITPDLEAVAKLVRSNHKIRKAAAELGQRYLTDGTTLLHGDFFPGSWLDLDGEIFIIDPEFSHCGTAEFDVGVAMGHMRICGIENDAIEAFITSYASKRPKTDAMLVAQFAAIEVLRRLLGVAQLPLTIDLESKQALVDEAVATLLF